MRSIYDQPKGGNGSQSRKRGSGSLLPARSFVWERQRRVHTKGNLDVIGDNEKCTPPRQLIAGLEARFRKNTDCKHLILSRDNDIADGGFVPLAARLLGHNARDLILTDSLLEKVLMQSLCSGVALCFRPAPRSLWRRVCGAAICRSNSSIYFP